MTPSSMTMVSIDCWVLEMIAKRRMRYYGPLHALSPRKDSVHVMIHRYVAELKRSNPPLNVNVTRKSA